MNWLLLAGIIVLVALPPKYDPAIRLKEWLIRKSIKKGRWCGDE